MHNFIITVSKQKVDCLNPDPKSIRITDIAWHLAKQCRYNNHLDKHYSNAEHCVLGARYLQDDIQLSREFIVHDNAEFVFGDVPSPVKQHCLDYKKLIHNFEGFLNLHFLGYWDLNPIIKLTDLAITETERRYFMDYHTDTEPLDIVPQCWNIFKAYDEFLKMFDNLFPEYKDLA